MPAPRTPSAELAELLKKAKAALDEQDLAQANEHMAAADDLCRRLQAAGLGIPAGEVQALRALADACGASLAGASRRLNSASMSGENHRRGIQSYHDTLLRGLR